MTEFLNVPTVDGHVHLRGSAGIEDQIRLIEQHGFSAINTVCTAVRNEASLAHLPSCLLAKAMYPEKIFVSGGLSYLKEQPTAEDFRRQAEAFLAAGCDGVKMIEGKPPVRKRTGLPLNSPLYDEFYRLLEQHGTPIVFHVADPETWWDPETAPASAKKNPYWEDPDMPSKEQLYAEVDGLLAKFPNLRIIFAHFYFLSDQPERAAAFMDKWPEISFDLAPGSEMFRNFAKRPEIWHDFFTKYQDRIIFATDNITPREPRDERYQSMVDKIWMMRMALETCEEFEGFGSVVRGIGLDRHVLEKIYYKNFHRYFGQKPKMLDLPAAIAFCQTTLKSIGPNPKDPAAPAELEETISRLETIAAAR